MAGLRLSLGIEIPNGDMEWKSDGAGSAGVPDGWTPSSQWTADAANGLLTASWARPQIATGTEASYRGSGRALTIALRQEASQTTGRYVQSPSSPLGQLFGAEAIAGPTLMNLRLRFWFRGKVAATAPVTGDWIVQVLAMADNGVSQLLGTGTAIVGSDFDVTTTARGWLQMESVALMLPTAGWTTGYPPTRLCVRIVPYRATNQGVGVSATASFAHFTLETLWPIDSGIDYYQSLEYAHRGYYTLSRGPLYRGIVPTRMRSFEKTQTLPSGQRRTLDLSAGMRKRTWQFEQPLLARADVNKLWLLWQANKGYATDSGTYFGLPQPVILMPMTQDEICPVAVSTRDQEVYPPRAYVVDFDGDEFPVEGYGGGFMPTGEANQLYRATLRFAER